MTNLSTHPLSVDGVRLDTLAWGIETQTYNSGGLRAGDLALPGLDGVVPTMLDAREAGMLSIGMFIRGTDEDGVVPADGDSIRELRENLDTLLAVFGQTHKLLDVREVIAPSAPAHSGVRWAGGKVLDAFAPELEPGRVARMVINVSIPGGYWRDDATQDWQQDPVTSGATYTVTTLARGSGPVLDAVALLEGPATDPAIVDVTSGHKVRLPGVLAAGQFWRVDTGNWESRTGSSLTLGSSPTVGTSRNADTETVGVSPYLLPLRPSIISGAPAVRVRVEGTGFTSATALSLRTRRAYL